MVTRKIIAALVLILSFALSANAQPYLPAKGKVFNDALIPRIDIFIDPDSLTEIMNNVFSNHEYPATFIFNDGLSIDTVFNVGFRLRGNTSRTAAKKSFKVSFNTFVKGQKFYGLQKMNLNGEHNDPSIIRSKLFWETAQRLRIPLCRANHTELYINGAYRGLYINVEHMDEIFLKLRYQNNWGNFYKCLYPANLAYLGNNANSYKITSGNRRVYDLKTNTGKDDYADLKNFITALSFGSGTVYQNNLEKVFNVNGFLRNYAFDVLTGNWDNYAGNMNNYYLYHDIETDKINYLTYDVDNTYGIDWMQQDWGLRNIYTWELDSANRPLITHLFAYQDYRDRFSFFMNKMIQGAASSANMNNYMDSIESLIDLSVFYDPYHNLDYGYTYYNFLDSYIQPLGGHVPYGLKPFIVTRNNSAASQMVLTNVAPVFSETRHVPFTPHAGDSVFIKSWVEDENTVSNVLLKYQVSSNGIWNTVALADDAMHYDDKANDGIFGGGIAPQAVGDTIFYYLENIDASGNTGREPRLGNMQLIVEPQPSLHINELMADNTFSVADNFGEFDDWFEIYNAGNATDMHRIFLSDDFNNPGKWNVGDTTINANGFMLLWADEQTQQGNNHTNFKLSTSGEQLAITEFNGIGYRVLDTLTFAQQFADVSIGCYPDGVKPIIILPTVTPGISNVINAIAINQNDILSVNAFPNPTTNLLTLNFESTNSTIQLLVFNALNQIVLQTTFKNSNTGMMKKEIDMSSMPAGVYCLEVKSKSKIEFIKIVKQ